MLTVEADAMIRVLDLFSGIGGFSLGLECTGGFRTVAFCEIDPFCTRVLNKHWPGVPVYDDVRTLTAARLAADGIVVDAICGGFPCTDISVAGKGAGIDGKESGLWSEYARIIGELRPRYVIVENVAALLGRGLSRVLGDLAALGYDAEWHCIPASAVGAPHRRDRIWIVAYPRCLGGVGRSGECGRSEAARTCDRVARPSEYAVDVAIASHSVSDQLRDKPRRGCGANGTCACELGHDGPEEFVANAGRLPTERYRPDIGEARQRDWWLVEPDVGRVAHGVPARVHRLRSLGNAVVPAIPEIIGHAILRQHLAPVSTVPPTD